MEKELSHNISYYITSVEHYYLYSGKSVHVYYLSHYITYIISVLLNRLY